MKTKTQLMKITGIKTATLVGIGIASSLVFMAIAVTSVSNTPVSNNVPISNTPMLRILSPNGGERLNPGETYPITWESQGLLNTVQIYYKDLNSSTLSPIQNGVPNTGSFSWNAYVGDTSFTQYKIVIKGYYLGSNGLAVYVSDESDNYFTLVNGPTIKIMSPNGGEKWKVGETHEITWCGDYLDNRNVSTSGSIKFYLASSTGLWKKMIYEFSKGESVGSCRPFSTPGPGSFSWKIDAIGGEKIKPGDYKIVADYIEANGVIPISDSSDLPFNITGGKIK